MTFPPLQYKQVNTSQRILTLDIMFYTQLQYHISICVGTKRVLQVYYLAINCKKHVDVTI